MNRYRSTVMTWLLLASAVVPVSIASTPGAGGDEDVPQEKAKLAYDQPLPDSVRRSMVDITVIDAATKSPIAIAEVMALNYVDLRFHRFPTNRQGRVRLVYPYSEKPTLALEVRKEGYVPQRSYWGSEKEKGDPPRQVTIALNRGVEIGGLVVDEAGQPLEGVTVVVSVEEYAPGERLKQPLATEILYEVPVQTGHDGRWRTASCPPTATKLSLQLIHPDHVSGGCETEAGPGLRRPPLDDLRKLTDRQTMVKGVRISGRITDVDGKPIPGARVVESSQGLTFLTYVRQAETDLDGRYRLHFDPDEKVKLTVQANGFEPITRSLTVTPNQGPVDFRLESGKVLRGRVVDLDGRPIPGAYAIIPRFTRHEGVFLRTWTDSNGRFVWGSAPSDNVDLSIGKEGYLGIERMSFASGEKETVVVMKPGLTVTFHVRDAGSGEFIKTFTTENKFTDAATGKVSWRPVLGSLDEGEYRVTVDATTGPHQFRVKAGGFESGISRAIKGEEKDVVEVINLKKIVPQ